MMTLDVCPSLWALLCTYWILCSWAAFLALQNWPWTALLKSAVLLSAARGKTWETRDRRLEAIADWAVPHAYFSHFYAIGFIVTATIAAISTWTHLLICFGLHVARRAGECCFLTKYPVGAKMHVLAYLYGVSYYVVVPISLSYPQFCPDQALGTPTSATLSLAELSFRALGYCIFLAGSVIQFHSHYILSQLQKQTTGNRYCLPRGGLFEWVSCPHYFGEVLVYIGLVLVDPKRVFPYLINIWVVVNLILGARETHEWYRRRYKAYPVKRRALIPFVY